MHPRRLAAMAIVLLCGVRAVHGALDYPLTVTLDARAQNAGAAVTSSVSITVDRLMEPNRRARVMDALKYGGYVNFMPALRALPAIGAIALGTRMVEVRYAHEEPHSKGRRLLVVADRPLFFLGDPAKARTGYELTIVDLLIDDEGAVTGTMTGAARVKPDRDGAVVLDDYAEVLVQLTGRVRRP
jgi:hypothetical protein